MKRLPKCYGIIPARYGSTRFPGKALALIRGKPMFWHVFERARQCPELSNVVLATDDERIAGAAKELDVPVLMTRKDHPNGTSRVMEAAEALGIPQDAVVVNIQGDEPVLNPAMLTELVLPFREKKIQVTTLAQEIDHRQARSPDQVKVVFSKSGRALYFSRLPIPYHQVNPNGEFYGHIGLYAFRMQVLSRFVSLRPSPLESAEKLEQLRLLENDIAIEVVMTAHESVGVDQPEDIQTVEKLLTKGL
ncbi:MAG: 3-deoxy-manno-octulosonate cytidylyltransferase [Deltaproteobacteria bacterium]|nr:3-deoxy-manno-octulosonate cytidylyltransferase [Deltaproteobacteria bacterium]MBW2602410.1 3-deoxy-manno-octulosonate cytidylyltransferase [Deltaproteobacteria bacterium]